MVYSNHHQHQAYQCYAYEWRGLVAITVNVVQGNLASTTLKLEWFRPDAINVTQGDLFDKVLRILLKFSQKAVNRLYLY